MKAGQSWKVKALVVGATAVLLAAAGILAWPGGRAPSPLSPTLALAAPLEQVPTSFDSAGAGMSAYLNTGAQIDLAKITSLLSPVYDKGTTHVVGNVSGVYLYADQSGWLVAYVDRGKPSSVMARWTPVSNILRGSVGLNEALKSAVEAIGQSWSALEGKVGYYHWGYPSATKLIFFSKRILELPANVSFLVPNTATLYEASWSGFSLGFCCPQIQLDGVDLSWQNYYSYLGDDYIDRYRKEAVISGLSLGSTHVLRLVPYSNRNIGVAVALVVK